MDRLRKVAPKKPELLAPLNNWKSLTKQSAVLKHADAVYFGLQANFSMRARAGNFAPEDIHTLVSKVHAAGKRAYLTTNILIYNQELIELYQILELAKDAAIDAIICHDIAAIMVCKQLQIPFHISTQANISNRISAKYYQELGAERVILARELSLQEIQEIIADVSIPVECFVHGAMCTAVSGRCYLSAEIMGYNPKFSANRGKCVQPCRRMYEFQGEEGERLEYESHSGMFFNAKDLCMIGHIPDLINANIHSFKIEGRMRDPEYIGTVTRCYRQAIDAYFNETYTQTKVDNWLEELRSVFNRGFHTGFYFSTPGPETIERTVRGNLATKKKQLLGIVINYYRKAHAVEIELTQGQIQQGDMILFENQADFYYKQSINSLRVDNQPIEISPPASAENHVIVGIHVDHPVPINAKVYRWV